MLFVVVLLLNPMYKLKYIRFWFREWNGKDNGDVISSRVWDVLKRLYIKRMGQNGISSSSGSGSDSSASLSRDFRPSVGNAFDCFKGYNTKFKQQLANEYSVECKSKLDMYFLESML